VSRVHLPFTMYDNVLVKYAHATGGVLDSERGVNGNREELRHYRRGGTQPIHAGYYSHQPVIDTRFRKIDVRVERAGMEVIAKTGYYTSGQDTR